VDVFFETRCTTAAAAAAVIYTEFICVT